jgi:D-glycero-D-manno-heptose 1,7-bisphosphate phosphatase
MKKPAMILLDRDGVINELCPHTNLGTLDSPARADQVRLTMTASAAIRRLNDNGLPCVVVSNQPGIAKGTLDHARLREVTQALVDQLLAGGARLDRIYYCLHHPDAVVPRLRVECPNRKPRPGLLLRACQRYRIAARNSWFIGDMVTDVQAGTAAGCRTALIRSPAALAGDPLWTSTRPWLVAPDLLSAVDMILDGVD